MVGDSIIVTTLHDIAGSAVAARFCHKMEVPHWLSITTDMHYTFSVPDFLHRFEKFLNKAGIYEAIWASNFKKPLDLGLLKGFCSVVASTKYHNDLLSELGIFLWDVYRITELPMWETMNSSPQTKSLWIGSSLIPCEVCSKCGDIYMPGSLDPSSRNG